MEALQTVFDYIYNIINIIKDFFLKLFPQQEDGAEDTTAAE